MNIVITGATGFIGSRLGAALKDRGHHVVGVARHVPAGTSASEWIAMDVAAATPAAWAPHLRGIDAVVNAVGLFRETRGQRFEAVHVAAAHALFEACVAQGVPRVVQVSALGADEGASTAYHLSKKAADDALLALPLEAAIVQPSLVFSPAGPSAQLFLAWASLPLLPLPAGGGQALQPVHVDDLVQALVVLVERMPLRGSRVPLVGPVPISLGTYLQALRHGLGLPPASTLSIPATLMRLLARAGDVLPGSVLDSASWQMLQRGNSASAGDISRLLGRPPRDASAFMTPEQAEAARTQALLAWLLPTLRAALAVVWIVTGIVSMGLYPVEASHALLARAGVPTAWRPSMLYGAAALDLALGVLTLWPMRRRRWLWLAQAALIVLYTAIISLRLPEYWLHPYGPVLKNLPMLALLLLLAMLEPARRR